MLRYRLSPATKMIFVLIYLVSAGICTVSACDSSMLELLTGASLQESYIAEMLAISSKMQATATLAQSFNNAATEKMHREVMEGWLYVASQITTSPPGSASADPDFHATVVQISREMGIIRQLIAERKLEIVHNNLEITVTRMSLLAAMINGHRRMLDFLSFELQTLGLRPYSHDFSHSRAAIAAADLKSVLNSLELPDNLSVSEKVAAFTKAYDKFCGFADQDEKKFSKNTLTAYLELYNNFAALKKQLLDDGYFSLNL